MANYNRLKKSDLKALCRERELSRNEKWEREEEKRGQKKRKEKD